MSKRHVLSIAGVNKTFGGLKALTDINLNIEEGKTHAIIGPNGAGKSTLLNTCIGRLKPDNGTITFEGTDLTGGNMTPHGINQLGVSRVFQTPEIFPDLTLLQNVMIPAFAKRDGAFSFNVFKGLREEKQLRDEAMHLLEDFEMQNLAHVHAGTICTWYSAWLTASVYWRKAQLLPKAHRMKSKVIQKCARLTWGLQRYDIQYHKSTKIRAHQSAWSIASVFFSMGSSFLLWRELHRSRR
jgi:ABC-type uncharacterized transport system ATPase subunit